MRPSILAVLKTHKKVKPSPALRSSVKTGHCANIKRKIDATSSMTSLTSHGRKSNQGNRRKNNLICRSQNRGVKTNKRTKAKLPAQTEPTANSTKTKGACSSMDTPGRNIRRHNNDRKGQVLMVKKEMDTQHNSSSVDLVPNVTRECPVGSSTYPRIFSPCRQGRGTRQGQKW